MKGVPSAALLEHVLAAHRQVGGRLRREGERPTWLDLAHKKLDAAVFAAYGWQPQMSDQDILAALLELNLQRSKEQC